MAITFDVTERFPVAPDRFYAALTDLEGARSWMDLGRFGGLLGRLMVGPYKQACVRDLVALRDHMAA